MTSRLGLFALGALVGALFGYWLSGFMEEVSVPGDYPFNYDGYVWVAALVIGLVVVFRRGRG